MSYEQPEQHRSRSWMSMCTACFGLFMLAGCAFFQPQSPIVCDMTVEPLDLPEPGPSIELPELPIAIPPLPPIVDVPPAVTDTVAEDPLPRAEEKGPAALTEPVTLPTVQDAVPEPEDHEYRVQPFDRIHIEVFGEPDISKIYVVSSTGTIKHPLLDVVPAADYTLAQIEQRLTELLKRDFLVNPRVSIRVEQSSGRRVTVLGEVKKTGTLYISPEQRFSLLNVIAAAGGFSELAAKSRVRIIRSVDGEERVIKVNCDDLLKGRSESGDVDLLPGDVIMVPETFF